MSSLPHLGRYGCAWLLPLGAAWLASCGDDTSTFEAGVGASDASVEAGTPERALPVADSGANPVVPAVATDAAIMQGDANAGGDGPARPPLDAASPLDASLDAASLQDGATTSADGAAAADAAADPDALRDQLIQKLRACGVVGDGPYYRRPIEDAFGRCTADCMLSSTCTALKSTTCTTTLRDPELLGCYANCSNLPFDDGFKCDVPVRRAWVCDLRRTCGGGEDEAGCQSFVCNNGQVIASPHFHCDGKAQCEDGSDELGCAPYCAS